MNQLELVLKTPIEDLVPKLIQFNNSELMTAVKNMLEPYKGIEYNESMIAQAKEDRATLNKFCTALDDGRKNIKKVYEEPLVKFTNEVNEVINSVKEVSNAIGEQLIVFDEKRKKEKYKEIEDSYNSLSDISKTVPYSKIHNPKWLNSSTSMTSVLSEMEAITVKINNDLTAITSMQSEFEPTLLAFYYRNLSLSEALTECKKLESEKERAMEIQAAKEAAVTEATEPVQMQMVQEPQQTEMKIIRFEVEATAEQFKALREFLLSNKIIYRSIK